jgi:hypothetical protein
MTSEMIETPASSIYSAKAQKRDEVNSTGA